MGTDKVIDAGSSKLLIGEKFVMEITGAGSTSTADNPNSKAKVKEAGDSKNVATSKPWSIWGEGDDWPQLLLEKMAKLGVAKSGLSFKSDLHYGSGIGWFRKDVNKETNTLKYVLADPDNWESISQRINFDKSLSTSINSKDVFSIAFLRFTLNPLDGVYKVETLDTPSCRLGYRNKKTGKIEKVYYGQDIHEKSTEEEVVKYSVYDEDNHEDFIATNKVFVYLERELSWGRFYYGEPNYYATFNNGWMDIAIEVPKLLKAIYGNQATLKYHVEIPISVFKSKYSSTANGSKNWDMMTTDEHNQAFRDYKQNIQDVISKAEAAGTSVFTIYNDGQDHVKISAIESKISSANDLPNNVAANSEFLFAAGVDPSLIGLNMPGAKDINGSGGSDKRESLKIAQSTLSRDRIETLKFVRLIGRLEGFDPALKPKFIDIDVSQTLDENPTGKKTIVGA